MVSDGGHELPVARTLRRLQRRSPGGAFCTARLTEGASRIPGPGAAMVELGCSGSGDFIYGAFGQPGQPSGGGRL
jgi:hypothetical protein